MFQTIKDQFSVKDQFSTKISVTSDLERGQSQDWESNCALYKHIGRGVEDST